VPFCGQRETTQLEPREGDCCQFDRGSECCGGVTGDAEKEYEGGIVECLSNNFRRGGQLNKTGCLDGGEMKEKRMEQFLKTRLRKNPRQGDPARRKRYSAFRQGTEKRVRQGGGKGKS